MMKNKIIVLLLILLMALSICSCGNSKEKEIDEGELNVEGSYAILMKEGWSYLVVYCPYPDDSFTNDNMELDLTNLEKYYSDEANQTSNSSGLVINNMINQLGYDRQIFLIRPIKITEKGIKKVIKNKEKVYITVTSNDGRVMIGTLKYNKKIKENN